MASLLEPLKAALPPSTADAATAAEFDQPPSDNPDALVADLTENPGLNPTHFDAGNRHGDEDDGDGDEEEEEEGEEEEADQETRRQKAKRLVKGAAHPVRLLKDHSNKKAAAKVAAARPVVPKANDRAFLRAQRRVEGRDTGAGDARAEDGEGGREESAGEEGGAQEGDVARLHELMGERDSLRMAWTMDEGVVRVVAVDRRPRAMPALREFERVDGDGNEEVQWKGFVGTCLLNASWPYTSPYVDEFGQVPFETDILRRHVHRLLLCSAPLQKWIVNLRAVYRWEDPYRTLGWVVLYVFLIGIDRVAAFFLGLIIWHVAMNGMYPSRPNESKNAIERKLDSKAAPATVAELIDQCDQNDWLLPLLDMIGPMIQLQLNDASDLLEILDNFYQWRDPIASIRTTSLLACGLIAFNILSVAFMLRCTWIMLGFLFFGLWPISSLHPQYRLLVSPARWAFWGVPTHAQWSISQLQLHAARVKRGLREKAEQDRDQGHDPTVLGSNGLPQVDLASFSCVFHSESRHPGKLVISTSGVRFQGVGKAHDPTKAAFYIPYPQLVEICKKQAKAKQAMPVNVATRLLNSMEITYGVDNGKALGQRQVVLENLRGRDRAFNLIVAFSGMEWKVLQPYTDE